MADLDGDGKADIARINCQDTTDPLYGTLLVGYSMGAGRYPGGHDPGYTETQGLASDLSHPIHPGRDPIYIIIDADRVIHPYLPLPVKLTLINRSNKVQRVPLLFPGAGFFTLKVKRPDGSLAIPLGNGNAIYRGKLHQELLPGHKLGQATCIGF